MIALALAECRDENEKLRATAAELTGARAEQEIETATLRQKLAAAVPELNDLRQRLYEAEQREAGLRALLHEIEEEGDLDHALGTSLARRVQMEANR